MTSTAMTDATNKCETDSQPRGLALEIDRQGLDDVCTDWSFCISLTGQDRGGSAQQVDDDPPTPTRASPVVPQHYVQAFASEGFVVIPNALSASDVAKLNQRLRAVVKGDNDRGRPPDKVMPKDSAALSNQLEDEIRPGAGHKSNSRRTKVIQIINMHKSDSLFRSLASDSGLGHVVAQLANWENGTRLAQDQVWAKPPGAPPLVFHRDSPYFMFEPDDVVTVWVALDDMDAAIGPLEYVRGSHRWGDGRVGTANQFFQSDYYAMVKSAAAKQGIERIEVVSMAGLPRGSISIHNGRTWHGSGKNQSETLPRRGVGLHFVPSQARFNAQAAKSSLWKHYVPDGEYEPELFDLSDEDFPITWTPTASMQ